MTTNPPADVQNLILRLKGVSYFPTAVDLNAIQNLVARGYGHGWYQLCDIVYPIMGNTAASQSLELKHPAVSTFNLVYTATVTNTAQGMTGDGLTGFANTNWNPSVSGVNWTGVTASIGLYCNLITPENGGPTGARNATFAGSLLGCNFPAFSGNYIAQTNGSVGNFAQTSGNTVNALFCCNRISTSQLQLWRAGALQATSTITTVATTAPFYLCGCNDNGVLSNQSTSRIAFVCYGGIIASAVNIALNTDVVQYQTILGRA
jgi:hypothetical protein